MRIFTKFATALAVAVPLMAATGTAQARDTTSWSVTIGSGHRDNGYHYGHRQRVLPPHVVRSWLQRSYYEVSRLDRRGDVYVARAEDRRGRDIRITADAYTGRVIDVDYIRRDRDRDRWDDRRDRRWR
ncbi:MAG: hypothetical protein QM698_04985 [Micropepsaceae bacterium]